MTAKKINASDNHITVISEHSKIGRTWAMLVLHGVCLMLARAPQRPQHPHAVEKGDDVADKAKEGQAEYFGASVHAHDDGRANDQ